MIGADMIAEVRNVQFLRRDQEVFQSLNLSVQRGKITAIMGPSGCGKTTLLRLLGGQLFPKKGEVRVLGESLGDLKQADLYRLRRRMGMLFQNGALFTNLSVYENVAFPLREHTDLDEEMIRYLVLMKLQAVGLRGAKNLKAGQLSGGMARRVALARAIALDPEFIMYDEPFAGQDPITKGILVELIRALNQAFHMTTVIVSHDVPETLRLADYVYILAGGKIIGEGTPSELLAVDSELVRQFLQGLPDGAVRYHYPAQKSMGPDVFGSEK